MRISLLGFSFKSVCLLLWDSVLSLWGLGKVGQAAPFFLGKPIICHSRLKIFIGSTQFTIVYVLSFKIRHCMTNFDDDKFVGF